MVDGSGGVRSKGQWEPKFPEERVLNAPVPALTNHTSSPPSTGSHPVFTAGGNREMRNGLAFGAAARILVAAVTNLETTAAGATGRRHALTAFSGLLARHTAARPRSAERCRPSAESCDGGVGGVYLREFVRPIRDGASSSCRARNRPITFEKVD
jgi:hypothetical protein